MSNYCQHKDPKQCEKGYCQRHQECAYVAANAPVSRAQAAQPAEPVNVELVEALQSYVNFAAHRRSYLGVLSEDMEAVDLKATTALSHAQGVQAAEPVNAELVGALPEIEAEWLSDNPNTSDLVAYVKAYAKAAHKLGRNAGLDEAAQLARLTVCDTHIPTGTKIYGSRAATAIESLKDNT